jgi:transposase
MQQSSNISPGYHDLPTDVATLQAEVLYLRQELDKLRRLIFGQKRERFVPVVNPEQLDIALDDVPTPAAAAATENIQYTRRKKASKQTPHGRNPLPADLPRKDIVIEPDADVSTLKKIGEEITEELEYEPGRLYVNRFIRPKYALPNDEGVIIGDLPTRPIEKGIAGAGLLSHILVSKFVDHLPLYRQAQQFKRHGVVLPLSTLTDWVKQSADVLEPLYDELKTRLLLAHYLQADESPLRVLDREKKGNCHLGYMWVYHAPLDGLVLFDYRKGRSRAGPNDMLRDFSGHLQTDAYNGYNDIIAKPDVTGIGCFAHARRKFNDALTVDAERAGCMLDYLQLLYAIEEQARADKLDHEARYRLRQTYALSLLAEMKGWLDKQCHQVLPKSALGKAIGYAMSQWSRLERYTEHGFLEIDNNWIENVIRSLALGRKNYLFAGSHDGARRAAIIYSLVATAKKHDVEPFAYLKDVIARIADHPHKKLTLLLPSHWKPSA